MKTTVVTSAYDDFDDDDDDDFFAAYDAKVSLQDTNERNGPGLFPDIA